MIISRIALKQNVTYDNVNEMIWGEKWYQSDFNNGNEKEPWSNTWLTDDEKTSIQSKYRTKISKRRGIHHV